MGAQFPRLLASLVLLSSILLATSVSADGHSFVLRAGRVITAGAAGEIVNGVIVVRDGRIEKVGGPDLPIPDDLPVHHRPHAVVMPGLVAADSDWGGRHQGDESLAGGYRAVDAFDVYGDYRRTLSAGVTTLHLDPGAHRLLTGQGAVVRLAGSPSSRILQPAGDLVIDLGVFDPPENSEITFPASSDTELVLPETQRPSSRLGQLLALRETLEDLTSNEGKFSTHRQDLARAWSENRRIRVSSEQAADIVAALGFLAAEGRSGYLVGATELLEVQGSVARAGLPVVFRPQTRFLASGGDVGIGDDVVVSEIRDVVALNRSIPLALAPGRSQTVENLRLLAVRAHAAGLDRGRAIAAITRVPAEILGVADRVGSIAPGRDADLLILTGDPLDVTTGVLEVFVGGQSSYEAPESHAVVVRAGTIWVGPDQQIHDGEMLIEDGKITAVGRSVPRPPHSRTIDAGPDGFVSPGFIDAGGHLGLEGDRSRVGMDVNLAHTVGVADEAAARVAGSGITTVLMRPYGIDGRGSRIAAVKTAGRTREERVVTELAGVAYSVQGRDPLDIPATLDRNIARGKKYVDAWAKYEKDLAAYEKKVAAGESVETQVVEEETTKEVEDPITGTWSGTAFGGPIPSPQAGKVAFRLQGSSVEGRVVEPDVPVEHRILLELDGKTLTGSIDVDTGGMGTPQVSAELVEPDKMTGTVSLGGIDVNFELERTDRAAPEFRVDRRTKIVGGRPQPPRTDPSLEPYHRLLAKEVPVVLDAASPVEIREAVRFIRGKYELPTVLLGGEDAELVADLLKKHEVGVVLPRAVIRSRKSRPYHQGRVLERLGLPVAFQSGTGDGARHLPAVALYAVEQGMSADVALASLTTHAARMFRLDDRIGTLQVGRDGDFVISRGHPFRQGAVIERVFVNGREVTR